jgi:hypothetical protein
MLSMTIIEELNTHESIFIYAIYSKRQHTAIYFNKFNELFLVIYTHIKCNLKIRMNNDRIYYEFINNLKQNA